MVNFECFEELQCFLDVHTQLNAFIMHMVFKLTFRSSL